MTIFPGNGVGRLWVVGLLALLESGSLVAQSLPPTLDACTRIAADKERLECFDRESAALSRRAPPLSRELAVAPEATSARQLTPEQKFGLSPDRVRQQEEHRGAAPAMKELQAHVTRLSGSGASRYMIVLDNGQVWRQTETRSSFSLRPGDLVTVSQGALGAFFLSTGPHNSTKVERVQ